MLSPTRILPEHAQSIHEICRRCSKNSKENLYIKNNAHKDFLDDVPHLVVVSPGNGPKFIQDLA